MAILFSSVMALMSLTALSKASKEKFLFLSLAITRNSEYVMERGEVFVNDLASEIGISQMLE